MSKAANLGILVGAGFAKWRAVSRSQANCLIWKSSPSAQGRAAGSNCSPREGSLARATPRWDVRGIYCSCVGARREATHRGDLVHRAPLIQPYIWQEWHAGRWRRHVLMIDENRKYQHPGVTRARELLLHLHSALSGIITPNYDLLVEYALGTRLFDYGRPSEVLSGRSAYPVSQWRNPVTLRGTIAVAKVHGSISWDKAGRHTDGRGGITGNALIVAPTPEKTPPPELAFEWELARDILQRSRALLFSDLHSIHMMKPCWHICGNMGGNC